LPYHFYITKAPDQQKPHKGVRLPNPTPWLELFPDPDVSLFCLFSYLIRRLAGMVVGDYSSENGAGCGGGHTPFCSV